MNKQDGAFLTIGELASELDLPQHILRYWESRFPSLRPLQRAGNRRYYRPEDVALVRRIHHLLNTEGYTIRGAQQALASNGKGAAKLAVASAVVENMQAPPAPVAEQSNGGIAGQDREGLIRQLSDIRARLESTLG